MNHRPSGMLYVFTKSDLEDVIPLDTDTGKTSFQITNEQTDSD